MKAIYINTFIFSIIVIALNSCDQSKEGKIPQEKKTEDIVEIMPKDSTIAFEHKSLTKLAKIGDSLVVSGKYLEAKEKYLSALQFEHIFSKDKKNIESKILECDKQLEIEKSPQGKAEKLLLGKRIFGVQFIWDRYGSAMVTKEGEILKISGKQYSKDKVEYTELDGVITILDEKTFTVKGKLRIYTKECCGVIEKTGTFTFLKSGTRKYWRLQDAGQLCDVYTCHYYLDIFD